jgi:hypothetical protein
MRYPNFQLLILYQYCIGEALGVWMGISPKAVDNLYVHDTKVFRAYIYISFLFYSV